MTPRAYQIGQRQAAAGQTRERVIEAARDLLAAGGSFSVDAIARQAGVARMTVYYQFGSKAGLLNALFDHLAARGLLDRLPAAYSQPQPIDALDGVIEAFVGFWTSDRDVIRRIHGLAFVDPEIGEVTLVREERRRLGLRSIVRRLAEDGDTRIPDATDEIADVIYTLTSFETFDMLADATRSGDDVVRILRRAVRALLRVEHSSTNT